ncbi:MAG: hypothetical protein AB7U63_16505, partial [Porticoccaceae bacterium]
AQQAKPQPETKTDREILINVIPAQAGIYHRLIFLDSRLRGSDGNRINQSVPSIQDCDIEYG